MRIRTSVLAPWSALACFGTAAIIGYCGEMGLVGMNAIPLFIGASLLGAITGVLAVVAVGVNIGLDPPSSVVIRMVAALVGAIGSFALLEQFFNDM